MALPGRDAPAFDLPLEEHRAQVLAWARSLAERGETVAGYPREYGGEDDLGGYISGFETLGFGDLSLLVKVGVQFGLFGGAVLHLGTGSDVQHLRTTATYDAGAQEFVVDTPDDDAHKMWIGNAARDGRTAAVFAQLIARMLVDAFGIPEPCLANARTIAGGA